MVSTEIFYEDSKLGRTDLIVEVQNYLFFIFKPSENILFLINIVGP